MHKHLQQVHDFHQRVGIAQPDYPHTAHLSDMDIVMHQALLMDRGSATFKAITSGDLAKILAGLVDLAYSALAPIACKGDDIVASSVTWRQDGSVVSVVKVLCDKISLCSSGETCHYSALYTICAQLAGGFINADFDKAFQMLHQHLMQQPIPGFSQPDQDYASRLTRASRPSPPDLSETLYE